MQAPHLVPGLPAPSALSRGAWVLPNSCRGAAATENAMQVDRLISFFCFTFLTHCAGEGLQYKTMTVNILSVLLLSRFSRVRLCATPYTEAHQAPRPWDSPGKNAGVGCHFLLQCIKVKSESKVAQSYRALSDPMDCSYLGCV